MISLISLRAASASRSTSSSLASNSFSRVRIGRLVRRGLHLRDHHPPQRQRAFERADIGAREMAVGGDIAVGQLVEQMADLADITIDSTDVTTIRMISPSAMPTILPRID